ncbi:MAG: hypothetical protein ACRC62_08720 [Microcoleus sp.]
MQAIEHGKRLYFRDLHHNSVVPGRALSFQAATKGTSLKTDEVFPWIKLAFPSEQIEFPPKAVAAIHALTSRRFYPRWIKGILPFEKIEGLAKAKEVPDPVAYISNEFVGFAPESINKEWVYFPVAVFDIPEDNEEPITLYVDGLLPVMDIIVPKVGRGYYTDEKFVITRHYEAAIASG